MLKRSPRRSDDGKTCVSESNGPLDEVLVGGDTRTPRTKSLALSLRGCPPSATNSAMAFGQQWGSKLPTRALHPGLGKKFYHLLTKQESHKGQWNSQGGTFKILYLYPSPSPTFIWFDLIWLDLILSGNDCRNPLLSGPVPLVPLYLHPQSHAKSSASMVPSPFKSILRNRACSRKQDMLQA